MPPVLSDSRRQTGAGRLLDTPGAALEVAVPEALAPRLEAAWRGAVQDLCADIGWPESTLAVRVFSGGLSLALAAPVDSLYTATEINEAAVRLAWAAVADEPRPEVDVEALRALAGRERDPALVALVDAAAAHGVSCLWDDEAVTLGLGAGGRTFPADALPTPAAVPWHDLCDVPVALVTGTNGKSTTVRMLAAMATAAGHTPGVSTTDYVAVGGETIEAGDFSGPMGARAALRDRRATAGVLEVARGGLLRRGVPVGRVSVAAVTNVASDHLGEYGVETVEALAEAKFVVARALGAGGRLVLSADDPASAREADRQAAALAARDVGMCWCSLDPTDARLEGAAMATSVVDGQIALRRRGGPWHALASIADVPSTSGGAARHNVRNALTAALAGAALGLPDEALAEGLRCFRGDSADNPGRANRTDVHGATVVVDFAHNAHGVEALVHYAAHLPAERRLILLSTAGDRSDEDMREIARAAQPFCADRTLATDLPGYRRGRAPGVVPDLLLSEAIALGAPADSVEAFVDPPAAVRAALAWARPGDVLLLVVLSHRAEVEALIRDAAS